MRDGILVRNSGIVQGLVVTAGMPVTRDFLRDHIGTGMDGRASVGDVVLDGVFYGRILGTWGGQGWELLKNDREGVYRRWTWHMWSGGVLRSKDIVNSQLGDGVNQSVVGDIDQELESRPREWRAGRLQRGRPTERCASARG